MDNSKAKSGITQIISKLGDEDLLGLTNTVTQGLLQVESRQDAMEAVIKYSPNIRSILKRKVVTKEILFSYLHDNNVSVALPASKDDLINLTCTYWNLQSPHDTCVLVKQEQPVSLLPAPDLNSEGAALDVNTLALKFSEWFYSMMNSDKPLGSEHFWHDSKLKLNLIASNGQATEQVDNNPLQISEMLFKTKTEHNLYFNPNCLKDGVQGRVDPHGLVAVLVCGTLHSNNACVGVFEQVFLLARDPYSDNNWKIKSTELNLKSKDNVRVPPSLCDSNLTSNLLSLPRR